MKKALIVGLSLLSLSSFAKDCSYTFESGNYDPMFGFDKTMEEAVPQLSASGWNFAELRRESTGLLVQKVTQVGTPKKNLLANVITSSFDNSVVEMKLELSLVNLKTGAVMNESEGDFLFKRTVFCEKGACDTYSSSTPGYKKAMRAAAASMASCQ